MAGNTGEVEAVHQQSPTEVSGIKNLVASIFRMRETGVLIALVLLFTVFSLSSAFFFNLGNLLNVLRQISLLGIIAMGMTMVIVSGEIDLSVGSVYSFSATVSGMLMINGYPIWLAIIAGLAGGLFFGIVNGVLVTYGRIAAIIVTLGTMNVARGAALILSKAEVISVNKRTVADPSIKAFLFSGQGKLWDIIPMMSIFLLVIAIIAYFIFHKSTFGFHMRAIGGNPLAARAAGLNVKLVKVAGFAITGFLCAVAGLLNLSFLANVQGTAGYGLELDVIAAVIIGGTKITGGEGTILGTIIGVLIIGILRNGLILLGVSPFWQILTIGVVIICAVGIDSWTAKNPS